MVKEFERYHGAVLARLLHGAGTKILLETYSSSNNSAYVVNASNGIYIKYSGKRLSPWRFSFTKRHQEEIEEMKQRLCSVFIVFVCGIDGIAVLSYAELKHVLDYNHDDVEWVAISRSAREMYLVKGSDGKLPFKAGKSDFPSKIFGDRAITA